MEVRRSQAQRRQAARSQIIDAAITVFAFKGYAAASMDDICLAAGCSKGGLYHHFPGKTDVLGAVVDHLAEGDALFPPFDGARAPMLPPDAIGRVVIDIWAQAAQDKAIGSRVRAAYSSVLSKTARADGPLLLTLRIGALIASLSRSDAIDADSVARQLGVAA